MNTLKLIATCGLVAAVSAGVAYAAPAQDKKDAAPAQKADMTAKIGAPAPAFTLKDTAGKDVSLADFKGKVVVLEWINPDCPVCREKMEDGSVSKMMSESKAADPNVVFLFINSTHYMADKPATSGDYLSKNKVEAAALVDGDGMVGKAYGAKTTPHCYVIAADGTLAYDGAIDDKGSTNYVVSAVKALKDGKPVSPATTKAYGCSVKYKK
ncbi:MAG: redoxin domain-containing protein [Phycisphaerales bacterium]|nr:redoxin domain-containing protein [Phycisphaerales bacterium]